MLQWGSPDSWELPLLTIRKGSAVAVRGPQKGTEEEWLCAAKKIQDFLSPGVVLHFGRVVEVWENPIYLKLNPKV